jgi:two-component sensor histidine kinase
VPIGMAVHELTTNAAKHGSLERDEFTFVRTRRE